MAVWFARSRKFTHFLTRNLFCVNCYRFHANPSYKTFASPSQPSRRPLELWDQSAAAGKMVVFRRFESAVAGEQTETLSALDNDDDVENEAIDFPGGKVSFTPTMKFISESTDKRVPCYRVLDDNGCPIAGSKFEQLNKETALKIYENMVTLQIMDTVFYEAQRQGRISFYLTSIGEEAINIATAAALAPDDIILPQYREPGILLWRGFTLQEFANQLFGNKHDFGKGRQMPIHYGSSKLNYVTISSPIATQLPQAVGIAYSLKMDNKEACVVVFAGDGATSEGDFHAGMNFAAVMESPVMFFVRNNGWAISTAVTEQFRSDGVVVKGQAYGIRSMRIDGNDTLAVYSAIRAAREMVIKEQKPILVEALAYRVGHHSTSDDSTKYRSLDEIEYWKTARSPLARFRKWIQRNSWWTDEEEAELRERIRKQVLQAIQVAEKAEKPPIRDMFTDVYDNPPLNLQEQEKSLRETIKRHPQDFPSEYMATTLIPTNLASSLCQMRGNSPNVFSAHKVSEVPLTSPNNLPLQDALSMYLLLDKVLINGDGMFVPKRCGV